MNVQIQTFEGYSNIAIYPVNPDDARIFCCLWSKENGMIGSYLPECKNSTYLPYFPGHAYIVYCGSGKENGKVTYFESEETMKSFMINYTSSPFIVMINVPIIYDTAISSSPIHYHKVINSNQNKLFSDIFSRRTQIN